MKETVYGDDSSHSQPKFDIDKVLGKLTIQTIPHYLIHSPYLKFEF